MMKQRSRRISAVLTTTALIVAVPGVGAANQSAHPVLYGAALAQLGAPAAAGAMAVPDSPDSFNATLPNGRRVTPAGVNVQVGMNPLNSVLTPDGKYLITSNDDERGGTGTGTGVDPLDTKNGAKVSRGRFTLGVTRTSDMTLVTSAIIPNRAAKANPGSVFVGRQNTDGKINGLFLGLVTVPAANGGYTLYAAGGNTDVVYRYAMTATGALPAPLQIPVPVPQDKTQATYGMAAPGWLTLSADGTTLYVVNNNGNSVTPIDLKPATPVAGTPVPVGYFPYAAQLFRNKLFVSNWGVTDRPFADGAGTTDANGNQVHVGTPLIGGGIGNNLFANPVTNPAKSSSLSVLSLKSGSPRLDRSVSLARPIDGVNIVGGTHPSALALASGRRAAALYVADANEDRIAVVDPVRERLIRKVTLPPPGNLWLDGRSGHAWSTRASDAGEDGPTFGLTPDALAVSPDQRKLYVAEAGLNSVAVYDISRVQSPRFLGRIPTGWYPTGVVVSPDGSSLFITNSKGAGSPYGFQGPSGKVTLDVNWMFGSVQKVDLATLDLRASTRQVDANTIAHKRVDMRTLRTLQHNIQHVVYILRENKTYDTYFGDDAVLNARGANGGGASFTRYAANVPNLRKLVEQFAIGDNVYADAEESNAGHSFALAATTTDYLQKTTLARSTRSLTNLKNQDPEDYPLQGYLFNAMARNKRTFRDYGDSIRVSGYDDGPTTNYCADDPKPACDNATYNNIQDTTSPTSGLGGLYSERVPTLKVLKGHLDQNYPGWNLRISDQRRAREFIHDFGALVKHGKAPQFTYLWLPDDHTGGCDSNGIACTPAQEVADSDKAVGQILDYLTHSRIWPHTAVFITEDDGQGSPDHVTPHRTYTSIVSPYVKHATVVHTLSSTVSIPKTIEEILNLPAMNYGDLLANDLLDWFTPKPNYAPFVPVDGSAYAATPPAPAVAQRIWDLAGRLTDSGYDQGTGQIGELNRLYDASLQLAAHQRGTANYQQRQDALYAEALQLVP